MYGIKVILKHSVENSNDVDFEEIILTIREDNIDLALKKAEDYVKGYCKDYLNVDKEKVVTEIYYISDIFESFDEDENGVREVYSKFITLSGKEYEKEYLKSLLNLKYIQKKD